VFNLCTCVKQLELYCFSGIIFKTRFKFANIEKECPMQTRKHISDSVFVLGFILYIGYFGLWLSIPILPVAGLFLGVPTGGWGFSISIFLAHWCYDIATYWQILVTGFMLLVVSSILSYNDKNTLAYRVMNCKTSGFYLYPQHIPYDEKREAERVHKAAMREMRRKK